MARELLVIALAAACGRDNAATPVTAPLASKPFYRIDAGPRTPCAIGTPCEVRLVLTALGDYHVNKDYPFKFVGDPAPAIPLAGTGAFSLDGPKRGTMTLAFQPGVPGPTKLAGTFKLSVCSDETCEIETPKLELTALVR